MKQVYSISKVYARVFSPPRVVRFGTIDFRGKVVTRPEDYSAQLGDMIIKAFEENPNLKNIIVNRSWVKTMKDIERGS